MSKYTDRETISVNSEGDSVIITFGGREGIMPWREAKAFGEMLRIKAHEAEVFEKAARGLKPITVSKRFTFD